jgi:ABC-type Fe3+/spermidine/putrescine transport system ATPase subunit
MSLEVAKLSKRYGSAWILRDVDLVAHEGRVLGICGGTGSGKSTLLAIIAGHTRADGGAIFLNAHDVMKTTRKERGISLLSGDGRVGPLELLGIRSQQGSSGERQIATLDEIMQKPGKVLLIDEAFCRADSFQRSSCFAKVRRFARSRDRIVVFASSDFRQIAELADDVAVLSNGSVLQTGTPQELYENPETIGAALTTGENNLFEARRLSSADTDLHEFHTVDGGHRIYAQFAEKRPLGAINRNVMLAIRPEQISISIGKSFPEGNSLRAIVTAINFHGDTTLIDFVAAGLQLTARVFRIAGLHVGDECMLGLPPHRIRILID